MIREIIIPKYDSLTIKIPMEYIDRKIEFIMFALDEEKSIKKYKSKKSNRIELLGGILNRYADLSKIELEDKAWDMHVLEKYR